MSQSKRKKWNHVNYFTNSSSYQLINLRNLIIILILILAQSTSSCSGPSSHYDKSSSHQSQTQPRLLFANRKDIRLLYVNPNQSRRSNTTVIVRNLQLATAIDVNIQADSVLICWSDSVLEKIECQQSSNNNSAQRKTLVWTNLPSPEDICMDTLTHKLYWTDSITNRIEVICLKTKLRRVIIWEDLDQPRAITLDTSSRVLFFSDWGEIPRLEKASMDGRNRKVLVDENIFWPNGLALDEVNKHLFWVDAKLHYIARVDYNGQNRVLVNQGGPLHPFSLAYYNNVLYMTDWHTNSLYSIRLDTKQIKVLTSTSKSNISPMDLVIYENRHNQNMKNPCETSDCSHLCLLSSANPDPSRLFTCACPIGVKLINETHCNEKGIEEYLIVARGQDIRRISLDTLDYTEVIIPFTGIKHLVTLDYFNGSIFWTDDEQRRIKKGSLLDDGDDGYSFQSSSSSSSSSSGESISSSNSFGSGRNTNKNSNKYRTVDVITTDIVHPDGLVIDWVGQNLYFTDAGTDRIEVARLDGKFRKILVSRGLYEPRAIALDPSERYGLMFFSDWGKRPRIERAKMDGSDRRILISENIYWPNGIAVDQGKIYWCDAKTYKIESADYDGRNRRELITENLPTHTFGFSLLGDFIYWTDWQRQTVERASKHNGENRSVIKEAFTDPMGLVAVKPKDINYNLNPCGWQHLECQHLCLYTGGGGSRDGENRNKNDTYYCACASGYMLDKDNKSCSFPNAFILYSNNGEIHRLSLAQNQNNDKNQGGGVYRSDILPVNGKRPSALDFDATDQRIYWTDTKTNSIFRTFVNGFETERVVDFGVVHPEGIAVDWLNRNMYWTDMGKNRIDVAKLNGNYRKTIIWDVEAPRAIIVQPTKGWLYWSSWSSDPSIEKSALDGSQRTILASRIGRAYGLALESEDFLYWSDIDNYLIERIHLVTGERVVILKNNDNQHGTLNFKPFSISTYQSKIYMEDQESSTILVFDTRNKTLDKIYYPTTTNSQQQQKSTSLQIQELKIYDKMKQAIGSHYTPCRDHNCSHICFAIAQSSSILTPTCACQSHYTLSPDNPNGCDPPVQYLLLTGVNHVSRYVESTFDSIVIGGLKKVSGVGIDRNFIYVITNGDLKQIKYPNPKSSSSSSSSSSTSSSSSSTSSGFSYNSNSNSQSGILSLNPNSNSNTNGQVIQGNVASFVVHGDVIFFSSSYTPSSHQNVNSGDDSEDDSQSADRIPIIKPGVQWNCINVTTMDGTYIGHITCTNDGYAYRWDQTSAGIDDLYLRSLSGSISPPLITNMKIYKDWLYYTVGNRLERTTLNGINKTLIANTTGDVGGFDIDREEDLIFFSDTISRKIYSCDIHGKDRRELGTAGKGRLGAPTKIAVMKRFVYWVDLTGGIERMDKWSGNERSRVVPRNENLTSILHVNTREMIKCDPDCIICLSGLTEPGDSFYSSTSKIRCTCPQGQILGPDGKSCFSKPLDCLPDEFQCKTGHVGCIHKRMICNGKAECQDASDESDCGVPCDDPVNKKNCITGFPTNPTGAAGCNDGTSSSCNTNMSFSPTSSHSGELIWILLPIAFILIGICAFFVIQRRKVQHRSPHHRRSPSINSRHHRNHAPLPTSSSFDFDGGEGSQNYPLDSHQRAQHHVSSNLIRGREGDGGIQSHGQQGKSSSTSSSNYHELLVPHPSPATTASRDHYNSHQSHHHGSSSSNSNSYCRRHKHNKFGHHRNHQNRNVLLDDEGDSPPCPCSSVCDTSDIYYGPFDAPPPSVTSSPRSLLRMHPYVPPPPSPT